MKLRLVPVPFAYLQSLAFKITAALLAAVVPALAVAGVLAATLIIVIGQAESDVERAASAARTLSEIRLMVEKEHGLVTRLPGELDLKKVDKYADQLQIIGSKIELRIGDLAANQRIVPSDVIAQIWQIRSKTSDAAAAILAAARNFSHNAALELVDRRFEKDSTALVVMLDAIASKIDAITVAALGRLDASVKIAWLLSPLGLIAALAAAAFAAWFVRRKVVMPLRRIGAGMHKLTENNLQVDLSAWPRTGELGDMTRAVEHFRDNIRARANLERDRDSDLHHAQEHNRRVDELVEEFKSQTEAVIGSLTSASAQLSAQASAMSKAAGENETMAKEVASSTASANAEVNAIAAAAEQIGVTLGLVTEEITAAQSIADTAATGARGAQGTMGGIVGSASQISGVITLIEQIAQQTNLLALNATIEAARAGELGKGFAVVASEVKHLASQTAAATGDVAAQIRALQDASTKGAAAVEQVAQAVAEMDAIAPRIAGMMHEQSAAAREINQSIRTAADSTARVLHSIAEVTETSKRTRGVSDDVGRAASEVAAQAEGLATSVRSFLKGLSAA